MKRIFSLFAMVWIVLGVLTAQENPQFTLQSYQQFLLDHQNLTSTQLRAFHPVGIFEAQIADPSSQPAYLDSIDKKYSLTSYEKELLAKHGFVVTSRLSKGSYLSGFAEIYNSDLPVFVSTDAILHAVHMSYDAILMDVERSMLIPFLDSLLTACHGQVSTLSIRYSSDSAMQTMLRDLDVYLTVPRILIGRPVVPYFSENLTVVNQLLDFIKAESPADVKLFGTTARTMDFSQFTVRGHYAQPEHPELSRYFQAMMWLGRTEMYLIAPKSAQSLPDADIQRQTIDAVLVAEALETAHASALLDTIDSTIRFFVGESDNVTLPQIKSVIQETGIKNASELLDLQRWKSFQDTLKQKAFAYQRINSQILMSDPMSPDQVEPASSFLLLGQRFVIDSYVTGSVIYDKIMYNGSKVRRMLPSTLDVLFALGNDAAAQLLEPELAHYHYATNLAAVRYLVDSYELEFWKSSLYNGWLSMIRTLKPPQDRTPLPTFMRTAAWWQEKMNTQLASWAQLRHDNLLYAKQSYSAGVICSYPESYVEPIPAFYHSLSTFADIAVTRFTLMGETRIRTYFSNMKKIADTLETIAQKTLTKTPLSLTERTFLKGMLIPPGGMCGAPYTGWYSSLYYRGEIDFGKNDLVVADVHTAPTDESGMPIGWVFHVGTGPLDMAILTAELPDGQYCAFVGPVLSYYEHLTTGFKRLTDEEWQTLYKNAPTLRPSFVNLYSANGTGVSMGEALSLTTSVENIPVHQQPSSFVLQQNYPNPFNPETIISFTIPPSLAYSIVEVKVVDIQGRAVRNIFKQTLPAGNYSAKWDGTLGNGVSAASGVYFYHVIVGTQHHTGKMLLVR
ncbi:MAG: DUF3160 domain-containing protein [Bacteroidota bacterium]